MATNPRSKTGKTSTRKTTRKKGGNPTKRSKIRDDKFFSLMCEHGNISKVCESLHVYTRRKIYEYRDKDPEFARRLKEAREFYVEKLEAECDRRAVEGTTKGVYFNGVEIARERVYSDNLLMFRLKALAPDKYRERQEIKHEGGGLKIEIVDAPDCTD